MTKNADVDKYKDFGYGIGFDRPRTFSLPSVKFGINIGVDMSCSVHVDNKKKDILILGEGSTKRLDDITLTTEKKFSIDFRESRKNFCLSLRYNGANCYLFVDGVGTIKFKAEGTEIKPALLCMGSTSKDFSVDSIKKTGLNGYGDDFSVDYDAIAADDILDIHKFLMKTHGVKQCSDLFKKYLLWQ